MRWSSEPNPWRWGFALLPIRLGDEVIWLERYWWRNGGDCIEVKPWR